MRTAILWLYQLSGQLEKLVHRNALLNIGMTGHVSEIDKGIAKEQARAVLPEGLIESRIYMNGTLRSWIHFIQLRSANGTQKEHQEVAKACAEAISKIFPMAKDLT